ncbi:hypothetical protein [Catenuloplanes indicus]|uniref:Uncharacterized protein n=1 Tax=Catenuloplanes indicus TaxID=137267 RepID=A0AAE4AUX1_9ACTN|nr:hypothetical protein [Catenuloplanes indicus]MDQ0363377.1 hypothetical protein [Catenuloplanes indicus]MDQ0371699.1 hypothetical protein [Catenuloplanes indicus]
MTIPTSAEGDVPWDAVDGWGGHYRSRIDPAWEVHEAAGGAGWELRNTATGSVRPIDTRGGLYAALDIAEAAIRSVVHGDPGSQRWTT